MWDKIKILVDLAILGWSIFSGEEERRIAAEEARIAAEEAAMWRSMFWIVVIVIVIAVLAFIIWRKHRRTAKEFRIVAICYNHFLID